MKAPQSIKERIWKTATVLITLPVIALAPAYIIASVLPSPSQDTTDNDADYQATSQNNRESDFEIIKLSITDSKTGTTIDGDVVVFGSTTATAPDSSSDEQPPVTLAENNGTIQITIRDNSEIPTLSLPFSDDECTLTLKTHDQRGFENRYTGSIRVIPPEADPSANIIGYTTCRIYLSQ